MSSQYKKFISPLYLMVSKEASQCSNYSALSHTFQIKFKGQNVTTQPMFLFRITINHNSMSTVLVKFNTKVFKCQLYKL